VLFCVQSVYAAITEYSRDRSIISRYEYLVAELRHLTEVMSQGVPPYCGASKQTCVREDPLLWGVELLMSLQLVFCELV